MNKIIPVFLLWLSIFSFGLQAQTKPALNKDSGERIRRLITKPLVSKTFRLSLYIVSDKAERLSWIKGWSWRHDNQKKTASKKLPEHFILYMNELFQVQDSLRLQARMLNLEKVQDSFFVKIRKYLSIQPTNISTRDVAWNIRNFMDTVRADTIFLNFVYTEFIADNDSVFHQPLPFLMKKLEWFDYFAYRWSKQFERCFWLAYLRSAPADAIIAFLSYKPKL